MGPTAPTVRALRDAPTARAMSRRSPGMCGKSIWRQWEYPPYPWGQGYLCPEEGDHREDLRDCERTARTPLYTIHREGADGDESRAYLCVHGLEETGKDPCQKEDQRFLKIIKCKMVLQKHILSDFPLYESIHAVVRDEATSVQIPNRKKPCEPLWKKPAHL